MIELMKECMEDIVALQSINARSYAVAREEGYKQGVHDGKQLSKVLSHAVLQFRDGLEDLDYWTLPDDSREELDELVGIAKAVIK